MARFSHHMGLPDTNGQQEYSYPTLDLNIAATHIGTSCLGPGFRAVVWVQGCAQACPGCLSPEWIPFHPARLAHPHQLAEELLADPRVTGLTFSGGEPMLQAAGLAELAHHARSLRKINLICFTGLRVEALLQSKDPGVFRLLSMVDVLIDGPYLRSLNDGRGLRGSSNQRIIHLSSCLTSENLESIPRRVEVFLKGEQAALVGIPSPAVADAFESAYATPTYRTGANHEWV